MVVGCVSVEGSRMEPQDIIRAYPEWAKEAYRDESNPEKYWQLLSTDELKAFGDVVQLQFDLFNEQN